jgi:RNA polymerase sigma factor (sigma-70 family)
MFNPALDHDPDAAVAPRRPPASGSGGAAAIPSTDGERLMQFRQHRDEAAFQAVVRAHAPLVWGICWQVLRRREDVEDAFQATFLILARKAHSIRAADSAAGWLYRVAFRTALAARQRRRRLGVEPMGDDPPAPLEDQLAAIERSEQCEALLEELHALAARYRQPLVLCYLEGRSRQEAADELGLSLAAVKGRLARGLRQLRTRLAYRGLALSTAAALLTREMAAAHATVAAAPIAQATALGASFAWRTPAVGGPGSTAAGGASAAVTLANKGLLAMKMAALAKPAIGLLAVGMTAGAIALAAGGRADGDRGATTARGAGSKTIVDLMASDAIDEFAAAEGEKSPLLSSVDAAGEPGELPEESPVPAVAAVPAAAAVDAVAAAPPAMATPPALPAAPALPGAPALPAAPAAADPAAGASLPQDVLIPVALAAPTVAPLDPTMVPLPRLDVSPPPAVNPPVAGPPVSAAVAAPRVSRAVMELQVKYWQLKGRGLRRKAEAMQMKAESLQRLDATPRAEVQEALADAELTEAEAMLCAAQAMQLEEALAAAADEVPPVSSTIPGATPPGAAALPGLPADPQAVLSAPTGTGGAGATIRFTPAAAAADVAAAQAQQFEALARQMEALARQNAELQRRLQELQSSQPPR